MKGRIWLVLGAAAGIAIGLGHLPYFAGAASTLSDNAERLVSSGGAAVVRAGARTGILHHVVEGVAAVLGVLVPGVTALLLVAAARFTLRLRVLVGLLVLILGVVGYHYVASGPATGTLVLALVAAAIAVLATGPLVALPLAALAALIGTEFLPRLASSRRSVPHSAVVGLHLALFGTPGSPLWLEIVVLVVAALPFAIAARLIVR